MDTQLFDSILWRIMLQDNGVYVVLFLIVASIHIVDCIYYYRTKSKTVPTIWQLLGISKKTHTSRLTMKQQVIWGYVCLLIVLLWLGWRVAPFAKDIGGSQYVYTYGKSDFDLQNEDTIAVHSEGQILELRIPSYTQSDISQRAGDTGFFLHSKETNILLGFYSTQEVYLQ